LGQFVDIKCPLDLEPLPLEAVPLQEVLDVRNLSLEQLVLLENLGNGDLVFWIKVLLVKIDLVLQRDFLLRPLLQLCPVRLQGLFQVSDPLEQRIGQPLFQASAHLRFRGEKVIFVA